MRLGVPLARLLDRIIEVEGYASLSEFCRVALREKIVKEAPSLLAELFDETSAGGGKA